MTKIVEDKQSPRCRLPATVTDLREVFPRRAGFCTSGNSDSYCWIRFIHLCRPGALHYISVRSSAISSSRHRDHGRCPCSAFTQQAVHSAYRNVFRSRLRRQIDLWQLGDRVAPIIGADSDAQQQNTSEYGAARVESRAALVFCDGPTLLRNRAREPASSI